MTFSDMSEEEEYLPHGTLETGGKPLHVQVKLANEETPLRRCVKSKPT